MKELKIQWGNIIKLNVGGDKFVTTKDTLTKIHGSMLATMFSGRYGVSMEEGHVFIDRDGELFRYILEYLREGSHWVPPDEDRLTQRLKKEFVFYGMDYPIPPEFLLCLCTPANMDDDNDDYWETGHLHGFKLYVRKTFMLLTAKFVLRSDEDVKMILCDYQMNIIASGLATKYEVDGGWYWYEGPLNTLLMAGDTYYVSFMSAVDDKGSIQFLTSEQEGNIPIMVGDCLAVTGKESNNDHRPDMVSDSGNWVVCDLTGRDP